MPSSGPSPRPLASSSMYVAPRSSYAPSVSSVTAAGVSTRRHAPATPRRDSMASSSSSRHMPNASTVTPSTLSALSSSLMRARGSASSALVADGGGGVGGVEAPPPGAAASGSASRGAPGAARGAPRRTPAAPGSSPSARSRGRPTATRARASRAARQRPRGGGDRLDLVGDDEGVRKRRALLGALLPALPHRLRFEVHRAAPPPSPRGALCRLHRAWAIRIGISGGGRGRQRGGGGALGERRGDGGERPARLLLRRVHRQSAGPQARRARGSALPLDSGGWRAGRARGRARRRWCAAPSSAS